MNNLISLDHLLPGEEAGVEYFHTKDTLTRRLVDLGFVKGNRVRCLMRSAAGDPSAYKIRGAVIALRNQDAGNIMVRPRDKAVLWD